MKFALIITWVILASLAKADEPAVLESWQVLMPNQKRFDFALEPKFCFAWDGASNPPVSLKQAIEAAQKGYGAIYEYLNPPRREVKSTRIMRSPDGSAYYQVLLGGPVPTGKFGATTGFSVDIPVAVGANSEVLKPVKVIEAWNKEDLPKQQYWSNLAIGGE